MGGIRQSRHYGGRLNSLAPKLTPDRVESLKTIFLNLTTLKEFCDLFSISRDELLLIYNPEYESFNRYKKGKTRTIYIPCPSLMAIQRDIHVYLNAVLLSYLYTKNEIKAVEICPTMYAYIPQMEDNLKLNIVENAKKHLGKNFVVNIDLENFFHEIKEDKIKELFTIKPFNFDQELSLFISKITSFNGFLPTGAPTSPVISNFIGLELDEVLRTIPNVTYTRYADDLTFSSNDYSINEINEIISLIYNIIENRGFKVNRNKTKVRRSTERQEVTGIITNQKPNVRRTYIRNIRAILHSIKTSGWETASVQYKQKYPLHYYRAINNYYSNGYFLSPWVIDKCVLGGNTWFFEESLRSRIEHIGYVRGKDDKIYLNLKNIFYSLRKARGRRFSVKFQPDSSTVFITNATAKSIVYYVLNYLRKNDKLDNDMIVLKERYTVEQGILSFEMLHSDFRNQGADFFKLFKLISTRENNHSDNSTPLIHGTHYHRKIFHASTECKQIRKDYKEDDGNFKNTGIFANEVRKVKPELYAIQRNFLEELGMRMCLICGG